MVLVGKYAEEAECSFPQAAGPEDPEAPGRGFGSCMALRWQASLQQSLQEACLGFLKQEPVHNVLLLGSWKGSLSLQDKAGGVTAPDELQL